VGTVEAFFVKRSGETPAFDAFCAAARASLRATTTPFRAESLVSSAWFRLIGAYDGVGVHEAMAGLSAALATSVVGVSEQTTAGLHRLIEFRGGRRVRELSFSIDEGWTEVAGEQQHWELKLFTPEALEMALESATPTEEPALREKFAQATLRAGDVVPPLSGLLLADARGLPWRDAALRSAKIRHLHPADIASRSFLIIGLSCAVTRAVLTPADPRSAWLLLAIFSAYWVGLGLRWRHAGAIAAYGGAFLGAAVLMLLSVAPFGRK
jgi:hypothetical protein